jgi:hypothetical protein
MDVPGVDRSSSAVSIEGFQDETLEEKNFYGAKLSFAKQHKLRRGGSQDFNLRTEKAFIPAYNGLNDKHLQGHFYNERTRKLLIQNGLLTKDNAVIEKRSKSVTLARVKSLVDPMDPKMYKTAKDCTLVISAKLPALRSSGSSPRANKLEVSIEKAARQRAKRDFPENFIPYLQHPVEFKPKNNGFGRGSLNFNKGHFTSYNFGREKGEQFHKLSNTMGKFPGKSSINDLQPMSKEELQDAFLKYKSQIAFGTEDLKDHQIMELLGIKPEHQRSLLVAQSKKTRTSSDYERLASIYRQKDYRLKSNAFTKESRYTSELIESELPTQFSKSGLRSFYPHFEKSPKNRDSQQDEQMGRSSPDLPEIKEVVRSSSSKRKEFLVPMIHIDSPERGKESKREDLNPSDYPKVNSRQRGGHSRGRSSPLENPNINNSKGATPKFEAEHSEATPNKESTNPHGNKRKPTPRPEEENGKDVYSPIGGSLGKQEVFGE